MRVAERGYGPVYRIGAVNRCPSCGRSHWHVGRVSAECAFCGTALPLTGREEAVMVDDGTTELVERLRMLGNQVPRWPSILEAATALERQSAALIEKDAEIARLREALRPFALEAEEWLHVTPDASPVLTMGPADSAPTMSEFTVGDLRRARTALSHTSGESDHAE